MTDRPRGSIIPVEVARADDVMSVAESEGVLIVLVKDPWTGLEDGASELDCA
jgi:hypothetical protein